MKSIIINIVISAFTAQLVFAINSKFLNKKLQSFQDNVINACVEGVSEYMEKRK